MMLLSGKRIFITEDNAGNLAVLATYLEGYGATLKSDRRGVNTVAALREHLPFDVILLDLMLPNNVSGFDLFDQIRQVPELTHIPVIAVSAADPDFAMSKARMKGFAGFISKPISVVVGRYIAEVLNGKQVWIAD